MDRPRSGLTPEQRGNHDDGCDALERFALWQPIACGGTESVGAKVYVILAST